MLYKEKIKDNKINWIIGYIKKRYKIIKLIELLFI